MAVHEYIILYYSSSTRTNFKLWHCCQKWAICCLSPPPHTHTQIAVDLQLCVTALFNIYRNVMGQNSGILLSVNCTSLWTLFPAFLPDKQKYGRFLGSPCCTYPCCASWTIWPIFTKPRIAVVMCFGHYTIFKVTLTNTLYQIYRICSRSFRPRVFLNTLIFKRMILDLYLLRVFHAPS